MVTMSMDGVSAEDGRTALLTPQHIPHIPRRWREAADRIGAGERHNTL